MSGVVVGQDVSIFVTHEKSEIDLLFHGGWLVVGQVLNKA